ncbi:MAG TPA: hypothetical protein VFN30_04300 [Chitinophagaceae bacterium]|nr:hypothetical protein [Chitinophagaceae bacterium]
MKYKYFFAFIIFISCKNTNKINAICSRKLILNDSTVYCQVKSIWVTNCFYFYRKNSRSSKGEFEKIIESDDGQKWKGKGHFIEKKEQMEMSSFLLVRTLNNAVKDTMYISSFVLYKNGNTLFDLNNNHKIIFFKQIKK